MSTLLSFMSRSGNEFDKLLAPHIDSLYRLAYRFTGQRHDAEDLVQELLLRLYKRRQTLREVRELKPWLARSLYNLYIDSVRSNQRSPLGLQDGDADEKLHQLIDPAPQPDNMAELDEIEKELARAINKLDEIHRSLIIMHDMEGYTLNDLSQIMALPVGTLKSRLHRARNKLREKIQNKREPFSTPQRVNA